MSAPLAAAVGTAGSRRLSEFTSTAPDPALPRAYVVFTGRADLAWLRLLRPGFRHCFVVIQDGSHWLSLEPLATFLDLVVQPVPSEFDLPAWYRERGFLVVPARLDRSHRRPAPWGPFTCVEVVKRALGLRDRWVLTPFQLYRKLRDQGSEDREQKQGAGTGRHYPIPDL